MLSVDENDGLRALQLTVMITFGAGVVGLYSGIDFSVLGLFLPLFLLCSASELLCYLRTLPAASVATSQSPVLCCLLFLAYDFNHCRLKRPRR